MKYLITRGKLDRTLLAVMNKVVVRQVEVTAATRTVKAPKEKTMMTKESYREYLHGRHWRRFRMKVIRDAGCCEICGTNYSGYNWCQRTEVHHWTYKNVPKEKREDVSRLCRLCHIDAHLVLDGRLDEIDLIERQMFEPDNQLVDRLVTYEYDKEWFVETVWALHGKANGQ